MDINMEYYKIFYYVAKELHKVGEEHVSQLAVSQSIRVWRKPYTAVHEVPKGVKRHKRKPYILCKAWL